MISLLRTVCIKKTEWLEFWNFLWILFIRWLFRACLRDLLACRVKRLWVFIPVLASEGARLCVCESIIHFQEVNRFQHLWKLSCPCDKQCSLLSATSVCKAEKKILEVLPEITRKMTGKIQNIIYGTKVKYSRHDGKVI